MVDFRQMPPVDPTRRKEKLARLKKLQNGSKFEYASTDADGKIRGRYLDYAGEWCVHTWDRFGKVRERMFAEFDIDWTSET